VTGEAAPRPADPAAAVVDLQLASGTGEVPAPARFREWVAAAATGRRDAVEVSVRIVGAAEGRRLNRDYRGKDRPTNVLAFPAELSPELGLPLIGDLVICAEVVGREAAEQAKPVDAHWAHLVVHGTLHLLGFDHRTEAEAAVMEREEIQILDALGYPDPYEYEAGHRNRREPVDETGSDDV
jgi:probable rRNA maturation factor